MLVRQLWLVLNQTVVKRPVFIPHETKVWRCVDNMSIPPFICFINMHCSIIVL